MKLKISRLVLILVYAFPTLLAAQTGNSSEFRVTDARAAGRHAADSVDVYGRAFSGFGSGILLGAVAPVAIYGRNTLAIGVTVAGVGWLIASAKAGNARPPQAIVDRVDPASQPAFIDSYSTRLRKRRARAALIGGGTGAVVGAGALVAFLVKLSND
ncbi:MAG TPA: hypothetical protein VF042_04705 [Gemmatimonadaceae bacterium]